jgi:dTDP-4-dehydrorhamnose 3,5-epimerase/CDP-3, 6-dideoxy-D-glycero-D-glycero-4-hexulose-5-epimerase
MNFKILKTKLKDVFIIKPYNFKDDRGNFLKIFQLKDFKKLKLKYIIKEIFINHSKKNVIRGMHYQVSPHQLTKIITVLKGKILDVVLCINKKSQQYGKIFSVQLSDKNKKILYIPEGFAHGYRVLSKSAIVCYATSKLHSLNSERCVLFNSFAFNWKCKSPILSKRDSNGKKFKKK